MTLCRLTQKVRNIYGHQARKAKEHHQGLGYTLSDLAGLVQAQLHGPCPYCRRMLTLESFTVDHRQPLSRQGKHELDNLLLVCRACNEVKGLLLEQEMLDLTQLVQTWPPKAQINFLARLRSGGKALAYLWKHY